MKSRASTRKIDHYVPKLFYQIKIRLRVGGIMKICKKSTIIVYLIFFFCFSRGNFTTILYKLRVSTLYVCCNIFVDIIDFETLKHPYLQNYEFFDFFFLLLCWILLLFPVFVWFVHRFLKEITHRRFYLVRMLKEIL